MKIKKYCIKFMMKLKFKNILFCRYDFNFEEVENILFKKKRFLENICKLFVIVIVDSLVIS